MTPDKDNNSGIFCSELIKTIGAELGSELGTELNSNLQGINKGNHFFVKIVNILLSIMNIISQISNNIINIFDTKDSIPSFIDFEDNFIITKSKINNMILDIIGISLTYSNQHKLLDLYKKYYKSKGIILRTNKAVKISFISLAGKITFNRYVLRPKTPKDYDLLVKNNQNTNIVPFDDYIGINMLNYKITPRAMVEISYWATLLLSYHSALIPIKRIMNIEISYETVRSVTNEIGKLIFTNEMKKANLINDLYNQCKLKEFHYNKKGIFYIEIDGAMINIHHNESFSLNFKQKNSSKNIKGDSKTAKTGWHENKLGLVFSSDNIVKKRRIIDKSVALNNKYDDDDEEYDVEILKRDYVSYIGGVEEFQKLLFACAIRNGYGEYEKTVLISDGATWIKNVKSLYFPDSLHILDFYHLSEHIYDFAKKYFNDNEKKYVPWAKMVKSAFKNSEYKSLLPEIKNMQNKVDDKAFNFYNYLINNKDSIDYKKYRELDLYIGSGHIESGNKSVLQERLKRPGMIWSLDVAQHLLTLRTKLKSNLWDIDVTNYIKEYCYKNNNLFFNIVNQ
ncbi:MAG: hypothetical protein LBS60_03040 [Deltaproteobacteria bacterium]|jgi:hypothetical protein|nr:hypothetical protein [Deltaproteobacteria bacterium]